MSRVNKGQIKIEKHTNTEDGICYVAERTMDSHFCILCVCACVLSHGRQSPAHLPTRYAVSNKHAENFKNKGILLLVEERRDILKIKIKDTNINSFVASVVFSILSFVYCCFE